jgi:catechol 2,3-dioxygenase
VSVAVYLLDPDENGVELYVDKPMDQWPRDPDGSMLMVNDRLDVDAIRALYPGPDAA